MPYQLAESVEHLEDYLRTDHPDGLMGFDTETTSLDTKRAKLVGMSFSLAEGEGIYVPIGHKIGENLPLKPVWEVVKNKLVTHKPIFYNAKYDLTIMQVATKEKITRFGDALELVYLADPDRMRKKLKEVAKEDLGFPMEKFEDLFTDAERKAKVFDISTKSPVRCTSYAAADADAALRVWKHFEYITKDFAFAVRVDHALIDIVRKIEHNGGLELNGEYINEQISILEERAAALRDQIFRIVGYRFEVASPKQLGIALFEKMGIPSQGMTRGANPIHSTREEVLEKLRLAYPIVELIISYRKVEKARSSYFSKLQELIRRKIKPRFNFNIFSAPTFRFAAPGGDPDRDGATGINIQAVSNGEARDIMGVLLKTSADSDDYLGRVGEEDLLVGDEVDLKAEGILDTNWMELTPPARDTARTKLPWVVNTEAGEKVCFRETCAGCPGSCKEDGIDLTRRVQKGVKMVPSVRQAFRSPKGYSLVSFDYDRQELVIGANMSGEPKWLKALAQKIDLHAVTACAAFGLTMERFLKLPKEEQERKRAIAKVLNFAIFYGATAYTLAMKGDLPKAIAEQIYDAFLKGHPTLFAWIQKVQIFSRKNGYTTTYFGRKRWLKRFYADPSPKIHAFGDRSAVNTAIQGTAAEVTRIAMVKCASALEEAGFSNKDVRFVLQIHDELAFLIRNDLVKAVVPIIKKAMEFNVKSWTVQLSVEPKIGVVWGQQKKINVDDLASGQYDDLLMEVA